jgi:hypothetical protein
MLAVLWLLFWLQNPHLSSIRTPSSLKEGKFQHRLRYPRCLVGSSQAWLIHRLKYLNLEHPGGST